jgi:uncharacterized membrane protein YhaH (DUF805 family)
MKKNALFTRSRINRSHFLAALLLLVLYLVVVLDVVTGLNFNLYGFGREPLIFALSTVVVATALYAFGKPWLGMIGLVLCCVWLVIHPAKNGFDAVLSPWLVISTLVWLWQKFKSQP